MNGRCDNEVGKPGNFHLCNKTAIVSCESYIKGDYAYRLEYCPKCAERAFVSDSFIQHKNAIYSAKFGDSFLFADGYFPDGKSRPLRRAHVVEPLAGEFARVK